MTRHTINILPQHRAVLADPGGSVLDAALAAGLNLPHSCKSGHCGSCRARLIAGEIDYPQGTPLGLAQGEAEQGYVLLCKARARTDLAIEARTIASVTDVEVKTLPCRIENLRLLAADVMQVMLRLPVVEDLRFQPGQYLDILLDGGRRRSFSIASPPHDARPLELHVRRAGTSGFTRALFEEFTAGTLLRIEGPLGHFVYSPGASPLLLVGGGTGFAPLKAILRHVLECVPPRPLHLYWGARTAADLYDDGWIREQVRLFPTLRYTPVLSAPSGSEAHRWVHEAVLADHPSLANHEVYAAGPPAMIEAIRHSFPRQGLPEANLHFDSFDYAPR